MLGVPIDDWFTYTNVAYLLSLAMTLFLSVALGRVSTISQAAKDVQLERYKTETAVKIAAANAEAETARKEAAQALEAAAVADQRAAEARAAAAIADEKAAMARAEAAVAEQKAAEANARAVGADRKAVEANLGVTKLRTPRFLDSARSRAVVNAIRRFQGTRFAIAVQMPDPDAMGLWPNIEEVLTAAGWQQTDWSGGVVMRQGFPLVGIGTISGVGIMYPPEGGSRFRNAAAALASALTQAGIDADAGPTPGMIGLAADALSITIGAKPLSPPGNGGAERQP